MLGLFFLFLADHLVIFDGLLKRLIEQAGVVDERDGHEAAETGHSLEVHAILTDDLLHELVLEGINDVFLATFGLGALLFLTFSFLGLFLGITLFENLMGKWRLLLAKHDINHELVALVRMSVLDDLRCLLVEVSLVISILFDILGGVDELTEVDAGGACLILDEVDQFLKVVFEVTTTLDAAEEQLLGAGHSSSGGLVLLRLFFSNLGRLFSFLSVLIPRHGSSALAILSQGLNFLLVGVVKEEFGEVGLRVVGLGPVRLGQSLAQHLSNVGLLEVSDLGHVAS